MLVEGTVWWSQPFGIWGASLFKQMHEKRTSWSHDKFLVWCLGLMSRCSISQGLCKGGADPPEEMNRRGCAMKDNMVGEAS